MTSPDDGPLADDAGTGAATDRERSGEGQARPRIGDTTRDDGVAVDTDGLLRLLVEAVRDYAIFAIDPTGIILSWNTGAERLKGYKAEEIIGRSFTSFYPPAEVERNEPAQHLEVAAREGRTEDEGWRVRKDGTRFWANAVLTALRDETGTLVGFAKVTRDLTERHAAEAQALADARRVSAAEAADRAKSEFLAAMSHELRTPLNAIGGYAELLEIGIGGPVTELQREYLGRIRSSQQYLLGIITDLLNYSRIEAGQVTYDMGPCSLHAVVQAVLPMVEPQAVARGLVLKNRCSGSDLVGWADRVRVEQIVVNLLTNAVKFTPPGGRISVLCTSTAERVFVTVQDTGPGIATDRLEVIFEPFVQLGRSLTSAHEGAGLGLAISRDLARAMNGDVTVVSAPGDGAAFTLSLRRA